MTAPHRATTLASSLALALALSSPLPASAQADAGLSADPYEGILSLAVDATDLSHRIFRVREEIPVKAGPVHLYYPQWLPGNHGPHGPVDQLGGLRFSVDGKPLPWRRDPLDMYRFRVDVPAGATVLVAEFEHLSPLDRAQGRVVVTPEIVGLQWNAVALYPVGYRADQIQVRPSVKLPIGWGFGTALEHDAPANAAGQVQFRQVDFDTLIDSPLLAGKYYKRFDLDPGSDRPVYMDVVADRASELEAKPEIIEKHRQMVRQAYKLYGAKHFRHYHFLLSISERYSGIGLEHHQSSEDGTGLGFLLDPKKMGSSDLMPHEFGHSWNGKFRRGADIATPHFNVPMQDSLLWVYEGQNQYWGNVMSARSGMRTAEQARDSLALVAAGYDYREGRVWRNLLDTTNQPIISDRRPQAWRSWQRGEDYYSEGELIWLDADTLIREKTGGKKSLDDFARAFFGVQDGRVTVLTYTFDDVVATLNSVLPYDWASFLRDRVEGTSAEPPLDGLTRGGWKLVYNEEPNAVAVASAREPAGASLTYSLGMSMGTDNKVGEVLWNGPAFKAGLAPGMVVVAINDEAATPDRLTDAVKAAKKTTTPIVLLVNSFDHIITVKLDYHGGLRNPHLQRIPGTPDRISQIHAPKK